MHRLKIFRDQFSIVFTYWHQTKRSRDPAERDERRRAGELGPQLGAAPRAAHVCGGAQVPPTSRYLVSPPRSR
ncbi:unnamed protein product [Colias eurytheme]|nr:unnamed protein product [Colias eurytheme]